MRSRGGLGVVRLIHFRDALGRFSRLPRVHRTRRQRTAPDRWPTNMALAAVQLALF
jgi:hypothetical protein